MKKLHFRQILFCLLALPLWAQPTLTPVQQKIATSLQTYFTLDRENIHLHLNKNIYLSNDRIWFKGYIIEKKNWPTHHTTNINLNLWDDKGQKISSQLYFAENGLFDGYLNIPDDIASGTYYIQAFTNYMNNFAEDESSVYSIAVINIRDKNFGWQQKINYDQLDVEFYPESGIFLEGVSNTIGLRIADCSGLGIALDNIEIVDSSNNLVANTATDQFGYGRFEIYNATRQAYAIRFKANGSTQERSLPFPSATGVAFSVNNYIYPDKAAIKVKTNAATAQTLSGNTLTLVVQQNDAASYAEVRLAPNTLEQNIIIPRTEISAGFNSIYLVDSDLKLMAQRVIYDPQESPPKSLLNIIEKRTESIKITGNSAIKAGTLSISVLPAATVNQHPDKPIQAGLRFDNYLSEPIAHIDYYLNDFSRKKHYELDHVLLTQKSKYDWQQMMTTAPVKKYESDFGLSIKGTINTDNSKGAIFKINMQSSALGFDEFTSPDANNEFIFKNLLAIDSAKIYFLPKDKTGKVLPHRIGYQILGNNRRFIKPFAPNTGHCSSPAIYESALPLPKIENSILLDSINVVAKNSKLKFRNRMGNMTARAFKITEADAHKMLLAFIGQNGFIVSRKDGTVSIASNMASNNTMVSGPSTMSSRTETVRTLLNGPSMTVRTTTRSTPQGAPKRGPVVFIDDVMVPNYDVLDNYSMSRVDEIYLNKHSNDMSVAGSSGIIKIYTKRNSGFISPTGSPSMMVKNGFQKYVPFQNPKYDNVREEGFQKLGTIFWNPIVETDASGTFGFSIPNLYQKSVCIVIEGLDADGTMISESHILEIP